VDGRNHQKKTWCSPEIYSTLPVRASLTEKQQIPHAKSVALPDARTSFHASDETLVNRSEGVEAKFIETHVASNGS
jgi:hypothetical protein